MSSCASIDSLVTPYVDGELPASDRGLVEYHLGVCASCRGRVAAERAARDLLVERRLSLQCSAPTLLRARCTAAIDGARRQTAKVAASSILAGTPRGRPVWRARFAPLAAAAALVVVAGGAFLYEATGRSTRLMAAELAADHVKCFTMNAAFGTQHSAESVRHTLASSFDWRTDVPRTADGELKLVGARPCLYGQGKVAHIMYRHNGHPVSLFMVPRTERPAQTLDTFGHACAIWSKDQRTFVLVSREPRDEMEKLAAVMQASMR
jgi:anti-sigma factor RsiW